MKMRSSGSFRAWSKKQIYQRLGPKARSIFFLGPCKWMKTENFNIRMMMDVVWIDWTGDKRLFYRTSNPSLKKHGENKSYGSLLWTFTIGMSRALRSSSVICIRASISTWKRQITVRREHAGINLTVNTFTYFFHLERGWIFLETQWFQEAINWRTSLNKKKKINKLRTSAANTAIKSWMLYGIKNW